MSDLKKFMRLPAVMEATGRGRSAIYADIKHGRFPAPINIGPRAVAWDAAAIEQWQQKQISSAANFRNS